MNKVEPREYGYWVRLQYDPAFEHFMVSGSFESTPNNMFIDGAVTQDRFVEYMKVLFHEVEDHKRQLRKK